MKVKLSQAHDAPLQGRCGNAAGYASPAHALRLSADKAAMERVVAEKDATLAL